MSVDVKEGMAVPAALSRMWVHVLVRESWTAYRCFPYHLVRCIMHSANLDPSSESMSLETGSGHPGRYVSNYIKGVVRRRPRFPEMPPNRHTSRKEVDED